MTSVEKDEACGEKTPTEKEPASEVPCSDDKPAKGDAATSEEPGAEAGDPLLTTEGGEVAAKEEPATKKVSMVV